MRLAAFSNFMKGQKRAGIRTYLLSPAWANPSSRYQLTPEARESHCNHWAQRQRKDDARQNHLWHSSADPGSFAL